jgi:hypothetical protein
VNISDLKPVREQDMRKGRYKRIRVLDQDLLFKLAQLGIPQEAVNVVGATLLPPDSLLKILEDRRQVADYNNLPPPPPPTNSSTSFQTQRKEPKGKKAFACIHVPM